MRVFNNKIKKKEWESVTQTNDATLEKDFAPTLIRKHIINRFYQFLSANG